MNLLNYLLSVMMRCWVAHWQSTGLEKLEAHDKLDELYNKIKSYTDEYVEISKSIDKVLVYPIQITVQSDEYDVRFYLKELRGSLLDIKEPEYNDWVGRFTTDLNHYIYLFGDIDTHKFFSKIKDNLVDAPIEVHRSFNNLVKYFDDYITDQKNVYQIVYVKQVGFTKPSIEDVQIEATDKDSALKIFNKKLKKSDDIKISKVKVFGIDESDSSTNYRSELRKELKGN